MNDLYAGMYDIDSPTVDVVRHKIIKCTRKEHKCIYCGKPIKAGSKALQETVIYRGEGIFTEYAHDVNCLTPTD